MHSSCHKDWSIWSAILIILNLNWHMKSHFLYLEGVMVSWFSGQPKIQNHVRFHQSKRLRYFLMRCISVVFDDERQFYCLSYSMNISILFDFGDWIVFLKLTKVMSILKVHDGGVYAIELARVLAGAPQLITIGADKTLAVWDTISFKVLLFTIGED